MRLKRNVSRSHLESLFWSLQRNLKPFLEILLLCAEYSCFLWIDRTTDSMQMWFALWIVLLLTVVTSLDEGFGCKDFSVVQMCYLSDFFGGEAESVWLCPSCAVVWYGSLFTRDSNKTRLMCKWPFTLPGSVRLVSASVMTVASAVTSLLSDALPGVKTNNKHSAPFFTPHFCLMLIVLLKTVPYCVYVSLTLKYTVLDFIAQKQLRQRGQKYWAFL